MVRKLTVASLGLVLLGCGGLPFELPGRAEPAPRELPVEAPREAASDFPTGPVEELCGRAGPRYRKLPEHRVDALFGELRELGAAEVKARICATDVRQEVAVGFTVLAEKGRDPRFLRAAADAYVEPVALATVGAAHATGTRGFARDDGAANRYRLASAAIARGVADRTGDEALAKRASRAAGDTSSITGDGGTIGAPDRDTVARIQGFVDARVERYEELYGGRERRTARR